MEQPVSNLPKQCWYNYYNFPIVPQLKFKNGNDYNTNGFTFSWLFIKAWSLDSFSFEIAVNASTHWGIGITAILPYLRLVFCIPCPTNLGIWFDRNFDRRPKKSY